MSSARASGRLGQAAEPVQQLGRPRVAHGRGDRAQALDAGGLGGLGLQRGQLGGQAVGPLDDRRAGSPAPATPRGSTPSAGRPPPSGTAGRAGSRSRSAPSQGADASSSARQAPACSTSRSAQVAGGAASDPDRPARSSRRGLDRLQPGRPTRPGRPASARRAAPTSRRTGSRGAADVSAARPKRVGQPLDDRRAEDRRRGLLPQPLLERDQAAQQVAAVDRRDVRRRQRLERLRCRTSCRSAPVLLQPVERVERLLQPVDQRAAGRCSRGRGRRGSRAAAGPCWSARSGGRSRPSGTSWKLSGGSQWSSSPTNVSKNRQVLRATRRKRGRSGVGQRRSCRRPRAG